MTALRATRGATDPRSAVEHTIHVIQGEHVVSADPNTVLVTVLGSCVAACLRDPWVGIGGMNHFLLPGELDGASNSSAERHAVHAMELLVNALLEQGASRRRLEGKLFGGACTMKGLADVGSKNSAFAVGFLQREGIELVSNCLGGQSGRRLKYWPVSGRARRSFIDYATPARPAAPVVPSSAGILELF